MAMPRWFSPTPERTRVVIREIREGSEPKFSYYALLMTAAMIACFGLVLNSTAVVIGAMLVSPLMTPIFGIAVAMLRGDTRLLGRALGAEAGGVALAIGASALFGLLPVVREATPEMLARTSPNLLDLLVALFAGFAGAYALLDERISPALPGVAIATAIVPPLSTCGLLLAMGANKGAFGALLLFLANFVAILFVALALFSIAGMAAAWKGVSFSGHLRAIAPAAVGFVAMGVILTHSLLRIIEDRYTEDVIENVLADEFSRGWATVDSFQYEEHDSRYQVLVVVRSPEPVAPRRVSHVQESLAKHLDAPVGLLVRTMLSKDVVAVDSDVKARKIDGDGVLFGNTLSEFEQKQRWAEQVLLEEFQSKPGIELRSAIYSEPNETPLVVANIRTIRALGQDEIVALKARLRERLHEPELDFAVRFTREEIASDEGKFLIEWTNSGKTTPEEERALHALRKVILEEVRKIPDVAPLGVHFHVKDGLCRVLVEVVGPRPITHEELVALQEKAAGYRHAPIELSVWYKADTVITTAGYSSYEDFTRRALQERIETLPKVLGAVAQE